MAERASIKIFKSYFFADSGQDVSAAPDATIKATGRAAYSPQAMLLPLILAQFVCSYAASNMNVAINDIARDLQTSVYDIQTVITVFALTMAALMIPGSKLTDIWGRKRCFLLGLYIYGAGALIAAVAQGVGLLMFGYSLLEGIGSALLIPPVYIFATVFFADIKSRAKAFGQISAMGGVGAAAGPLIGGLITTAISWRASFIAQAILVAVIIYLSRRIVDPGAPEPKPKFDLWGAVISAAALFSIVAGILLIKTYGLFSASQDFKIGDTVLIHQGGISPVWLFIGIGALLLLWFFLRARSWQRKGKQPLLSTKLFLNKTSNLGLLTQLIQWFMLLGSSFVISVFFQVVRGYSAVKTGLVLAPAIIGMLLTSAAAARLAKKYAQKTLIISGFVTTILGTIIFLLTTNATSNVWSSVPGLLLLGMGIGVMLTSSVNIVQSSFSEKEQGEISGLSRSVSNLGSSFGTAIAGTVLIAAASIGNKSYGLSLITIVLFGIIGLIAAMFLPREVNQPGAANN